MTQNENSYPTRHTQQNKKKLPFFSTVPLWWIHVRKKKRAAECKELQTIGLKHEKSIKQMLANIERKNARK